MRFRTFSPRAAVRDGCGMLCGCLFKETSEIIILSKF